MNTFIQKSLAMAEYDPQQVCAEQGFGSGPRYRIRGPDPFEQNQISFTPMKVLWALDPDQKKFENLIKIQAKKIRIRPESDPKP